MPEPRKELVESVVRDRAYRLSHSHGAATPEDSNRSVVDGALVTPGRGRLLVFFPDVNLYHGLESDESRGYISVNNNPPQDTWLAYYDELPGQREFGSCLLSWVPRVFVASVDAAINVSPERCIEWLENLPCTLADEVRARSSRA